MIYSFHINSHKLKFIKFKKIHNDFLFKMQKIASETFFSPLSFYINNKKLTLNILPLWLYHLDHKEPNFY